LIHPHLRFLGKALLLTGVLAGLCALPVRAWWGEAGLRSLAVAAVAVLLGAAAGRLPWVLIPATTPDAPVHAAMAGIGARLLVTSTLALVAILTRLADGIPFAAPVGVLYLALLGLEVRETLAGVRSPARVAGHPEQGVR
jgi:hypothetical protein